MSDIGTALDRKIAAAMAAGSSGPLGDAVKRLNTIRPVAGVTVTQAHHLLILNADDYRAHLVHTWRRGLSLFRKN